MCAARRYRGRGSGSSSGSSPRGPATPRTLTELYFDTVQASATRPVATRIKRDGRWIELSYRELAERVQAASIGLRELGVVDGDRVAILSENRPEWAITDYACLAPRCTDVPIYPTLPARQAEYILRDSGAVAVLVSSAAQLEKVLAVRDRLPAI